MKIYPFFLDFDKSWIVHPQIWIQPLDIFWGLSPDLIYLLTARRQAPPVEILPCFVFGCDTYMSFVFSIFSCLSCFSW